MARRNILTAEQSRAGGLPDCLIPGPVPQRVVDLLEVVQVHNEQGARLLLRHVLQPILDAVLQGGPIQQAGQHVLGRAPFQFFQYLSLDAALSGSALIGVSHTLLPRLPASAAHSRRAAPGQLTSQQIRIYILYPTGA